MQMKREGIVPRGTLRLWQLRIGIIAAVLLLILFRLCFVTLWILIPMALILSFAVIVMFWYLPLYFRCFKVIYDDGAFEIRRGVFFKVTLIMPYPRLIYVSAFSSPVARKMGLSGAVLKAARGFVIIPELEKEDIKGLIRIASGEQI